jgi:WD40 repeat protein
MVVFCSVPQFLIGQFSMRVIVTTQPKPVCGVSFAPDGNTLLAGGNAGYDVWDLSSDRQLHLPSHPATKIFGCLCDPLGRWAYVSDHRAGFQLLALDGGEAGIIPGSEYATHVRSFHLSSVGDLLAMSRGGGSNRLELWTINPAGEFQAAWSLIDGQPVDPDDEYLLKQTTWSINEVAITPAGHVLAAETREPGGSGKAPYLVLRDRKDGSSIAELGRSDTSYDVHLTAAANGKHVYAWDETMIEQWDLSTQDLNHRIPSPGRSGFTGLAIDPTSQQLVTVSGDGKTRYWEPETLSLVHEEKLTVGKLLSVDVSANGQAAAGGTKGQIALWQVSP